ncbi:HSP40/DnaJ peptide-binding protein [Hirschfeldia incana]|nr:HSP40/DnaJ peptide-binding protein [Hirschfeldia incana]
MATQGVAQPSTKKRSFLLRDIFKICRSVSRVLPREKPNHKHERKLHNESKRHEEHKSNVTNEPNAFNFQEAKATKVVGGSLCKARSYNRLNSVGHKEPLSLSRSYSHNTAAAARQSSSCIGRSKSSSNRAVSAGFMPTLMRSTTTSPRRFSNPILYSTSSEKVAKPQPTEKKLSCTLEELCNGCTKRIKIKRDVITTTSGQLSEEEETVEIKVKPGWKEGTKVTFEGKGNEAMGSCVPADLIFVIVEKEHEVFKRNGDDLEMALEVSLLEALTGFELCVALPDGDNMSLKIEDVIHHGYVTVIHGKGMPKPKENGKTRGDLRVRFRTKFPEQLTDAQRSEIQSILQNDS